MLVVKEGEFAVVSPDDARQARVKWALGQRLP
jgi:hypothetical protein